MVKVILLILVVSGCSTVETFNPVQDEGTIKYKLLSFDDIQKKCNPNKAMAVTNGCSFPQSWGWIVYSVRNRECFYHELEHALFGFFHKNEVADCTKRSYDY